MSLPLLDTAGGIVFLGCLSVLPSLCVYVLINRLEKFSQIYSFGAVGTKMKSQSHGQIKCGQKFTCVAILLPRNIDLTDDCLN